MFKRGRLLLVEQNARQALKVSNRAYVLKTGCITVSGTLQEPMDNSHVKGG